MHEENTKVLDLGHALVLERGLGTNETEYVHVCFCSEILYTEFTARHSYLTRAIAKEVGASLRASFSKTASVHHIEGPAVYEALVRFLDQLDIKLQSLQIRAL